MDKGDTIHKTLPQWDELKTSLAETGSKRLGTIKKGNPSENWIARFCANARSASWKWISGLRFANEEQLVYSNDIRIVYKHGKKSFFGRNRSPRV